MVCIMGKWVPDTYEGAIDNGWRGPRMYLAAMPNQPGTHAEKTFVVSDLDTQELIKFTDLIQPAIMRGPDEDYRTRNPPPGPGELAYVYFEGHRIKAHYINLSDGQEDLIYWTEYAGDCV